MLFALTAQAQPRGGASGSKRSSGKDSTQVTPRGLKTWTVDERFGTITPTEPDTMQHLFQNTSLTDGLHGVYNHTGNLSAPRMSRIYNGQQDYMMGSQFIFMRPYDMAISSVNDCLFTNTKSPITNLSWFTQGKITGSDRLRVNFATNINKDAGVGFKVDYLYGRGHYSHQNHSSIASKLYGSYRGERYQMHTAYVMDRTKNAENGGLTDENYVTHPEYYSTKYKPADMPVRTEWAYNGLKINTLFLTHRYNLGYYAVKDSLGNTHRIHNPNAKDKKSKAAEKALAAMVGTIKDSLFVKNDSLLGALSGKLLLTTKDSLQQYAEQLAAARMNALKGPTKTDAAESDTLIIKGTTAFVPVAAFVHTAKFDHNTRGYYDYNRDRSFYIENIFPENDSIIDRTRYLSVENTLALEMSEGFKKWVKTGMRVFAKHQLTRFTLPDTLHAQRGETFNYITLGAQLMKEKGSVFRYNLLGEIRTTGVDWGEFNVEGNVRFNIPVRRDSILLGVDGFVRNEEPAYYYRHFHSNAAWWDNDLSKVFRSRIQGSFDWSTTRTFGWIKTRLKAAFETIQNHTFMQEVVAPADIVTEYSLATARYGVNVAQADKNVRVISATLCQDFKYRAIVWENEVTYQTSSNQDVLPVPTLNVWSNLYLHFKVAKVLSADLGGDVRYFTSYYAPAYSPMIGLYAVQDVATREKVGNYPWVNVYANFHLKSCRFYVMFTHVNSSAGRPFLVPHYPTDRRCLRIGISWNFFN